MIKKGILPDMKTIYFISALLFITSIFINGQTDADLKPEFKCLLKAQLPTPVGQLRIAQMELGRDKKQGFAVIYGEDTNIDPWQEAFFYPSGTLKISVINAQGEILWTKDLGKGVVPGVAFCPMCAFDLDGDGVDEIYYVGNTDDYHPFRVSKYRLIRLNGLTGEQNGEWKWTLRDAEQSLSHTFRNFIICGYIKGEPVLVTAQGVYGTMSFQAYGPGMKLRWERVILKTEPGARGSHMCAISDMNQDGIQEFMWGERCIDLSTGVDLFCADKDTYNGHSDIAQPVWDDISKKWYLYTCREGQLKVPPRICMYDNTGKRVWGNVDEGHIDQGSVARIGDNYRQVAYALKIDNKTFEKEGIVRTGQIQYHFDALTGKEVKLNFSLSGKLPVDVDGDGYHELISKGEMEAVVYDRKGKEIATLNGNVVLAGKLADLPGEQIVTHKNGELMLLTDSNAKDCPFALERYKNPLYKINLKNTSNNSISGI